MPASAVPAAPAFRAAFRPLLQARPALEGVQIEPIWPGPSAEPRAIYLASGETGPSGRLEVATIKTGRQRLNEVSDVTLALWAWQATDTPDDDPEPALFFLFNEVVGTLQDNPSVTETIQWNSGISYSVRYPPVGTGRGALMEVVLTLNARLI